MTTQFSRNKAEELKRFLRAMRARLDPRDVGLPVLERRRRGSGLRMEEVAGLADVGLTWYSALESGKDIRVSRNLLERVARALRMDADERALLFALALPEFDAATNTDTAHLDAIVAGFTIGPAFVCDPFWNVGSCNALANIVYGHDRSAEKNLLARILLDPAFRGLHDDWEDVAQRMVGILHLAYGTATDDAAAIALITRLSDASAPFKEWWSAYRVRDYEPKVMTIRHPTLGQLDLLMSSFIATTFVARQADAMIVLQPPMNDETRRRFAQAIAEG